MSRVYLGVTAGLALALASGGAGRAQVVLSEFVASNTNGLRDRFGDTSDWIELHNPSTAAVNLAGWRLTDNPGNLSKWVFPATNIAPRGFLIVFASNRDRAVAGEELHTSFKLDGAGEYLALVDATGAVATAYAPAYPPQREDASYGIPALAELPSRLVPTNGPVRYLVPTNTDLAAEWTGGDPLFDDAAWLAGQLGLGYETSSALPNYRAFILANVSNLMFRKKTAILARIPFVVDDPTAFQSLRLDVRYDDGLVAYLNGQEVLSRNAPDPLQWNSLATTTNNGQALETFYLSDRLGHLVPGTNWLAAAVLNNATNSSDLLFAPQLIASALVPWSNGSAYAYFRTPTPGATNAPGTTTLGPLFLGVVSEWTNVTAGGSLLLTARVDRGYYPVSNVTVYYRTMFANEVALPLNDQGAGGDATAGDGVFSGILPATGLQPGQMLRWRYQALDTGTNASRSPPFYDPSDYAEYYGAVLDDPSITSRLPVIHWFVANTAAVDSISGGRCSFWFRGRFYDNCRADRHGQSSGGFPKKSYNIDFTEDARFVLDDALPPLKDLDFITNWADKSKLRNTLAYGTWAAIGHPAHFARVARLQRNGTFFSTCDLIEDADDVFLERVGLDPEAPLYKMYNRLDGWVSPGAEKKTRRYEGNADLQDLVLGLGSNQTPQRRLYLYDHVDLPTAIDYFAGLAVINDTDHGHKNYYLYRDTDGTRDWYIMPWDQDLSFGHCWRSNYFDDAIYYTNIIVYSQNNRLYDAIYRSLETSNMVMRRVRTLTDRLLQPAAAPPDGRGYENWIAQLTEQIDPEPGVSDADLDFAQWGSWTTTQTMREAMARITNLFLPGRRQYLHATLGRAGGGPVPDSQPTNAALAFGRIEFSPANGNQDQEYVELLNTNAYYIDISGWSLTGAVEFTFRPGTVLPPGSNLFVSPALPAFRARTISPRSNEAAFVQGPYRGHLSAWGETLGLVNDAGATVATRTYAGSPSLWQMGLRITEVMYHPDGDAPGFPDENDGEFIELYNIGGAPLSLAGVRLTGAVHCVLGAAILQPGEFAVVVADEAAFRARYDTNGVRILGAYTNHLGNEGETVKLEDPKNETILEFRYDDQWVPATAGDGWSLTIRNAYTGHQTWDEAASWRASVIPGGTPGRAESEAPPGIIAITEVLSHSDTGVDWIEIQNRAGMDLDLEGWYLSDDPANLRKYVFPGGSLIPDGGFLVVTEDQFNQPGAPGCLVPFALSELGDEVWLTQALFGELLEYRDVARLGPADRDVPGARVESCDGLVSFVAASAATPGQSNAPPQAGPVVLSEVMYHPASGQVEYVELHNVSAAEVVLFDAARPTNRWRLSGGADYTFPPGARLAAGAYAVVAATASNDFVARYPVPAGVPVFGPFTNGLSNAGDWVHLKRPGDPEPDGFVPMYAVDELRYDDVAPWPPGADGTGAPLERMDEASPGTDPCNWRAANLLGSPGTGTQLDLDGDGLPDDWEQLHFGSAAGGAGDDHDGDGSSDLAEFVAGSSPTSAWDAPTARIESGDGGPVVTYDGAPAAGVGYLGRTRWYRLEATAALAAEAWLPLPGSTSTPAVAGPVAFTNATDGTGRRVRVRIWLEPP